MIRFLHLADVHLGATPNALGGLAQARAEDLCDAFRRAVTYAVERENGVHAVLMAGDLFDSIVPKADVLSFAMGQLRKLRQADIPAILAPGNHDPASGPGSLYADQASELRKLVYLAASPNVEHLATLTLNGEPVSFYGMAWDPMRSQPPYDTFRADDPQGYHIAVIHGTLDKARFAELHSRDVPLNLGRLAHSGMDYIALGHVHAYQEHRAGAIPVVYPGTLEARRLTRGETGERSLLVVTLEKGRPPTLQRRPWNRRTLRIEALDLDAEAVEAEEDLVALISSRYGDSNTLLRLELAGSPPFMVDVERLQAGLNDDFCYLDLADNTNPFDSAFANSWAQEQTIRGLYLRKLQAHVQSAQSEEERKKAELALKLGAALFSEESRG